MGADLTLETLTGAALQAAIPDLARLRIAVFREWPYLYDGDLAYEADYLQVYTRTSDAVLVAARDGDRIVGASTGLPLTTQSRAFQHAFRQRGHDPDRVFYLGESVLDAAYRGRGVGVRFFQAREQHARRSGYDLAAFCGVVRPAEHPLRPPGYVPLDAFWTRRGYTRAEGLVATLSWQDLDRAEPTDHPVQFWTRALTPPGATG